jgi:hypothetical protein
MFRLALALGEWNVDALLQRMPVPLLIEWMAYYSIEPFGSNMDDLRAGVLASLTANIHRDEKKQRQPFEPADFFPWLGKREKPGWERVFEGMQAFNMRVKK